MKFPGLLNWLPVKIPSPGGVGVGSTFLSLIFLAVHNISRTFDFFYPLKSPPPLDPPGMRWVELFLVRMIPRSIRIMRTKFGCNQTVVSKMGGGQCGTDTLTHTRTHTHTRAHTHERKHRHTDRQQRDAAVLYSRQWHNISQVLRKCRAKTSVLGTVLSVPGQLHI